jgi:hypothetical protein
MGVPRVTLAEFLLWAPVAPIWLYVTFVVGSSNGLGGGPVGYVVAPLSLFGIAMALHRLVRGWRSAWALCALAAPILAFLILMAIAWLNFRYS